MANLVVRNLDQEIVDALKQRAAQHGRSMEAEHRALLEELLLRPKGKSFAEVLKAWEGKSVTIINPQSYTVSKITDGISFESYTATLTAVSEDHIQVTFAHKKREQEQPVNQFIPMRWIKRASNWGEQNYIQL